MTLKLTDNQLFSVLRQMSKEQLTDFLADDIERGVDWICYFINNFVDSEELQQKIKSSLPPIQMTLFND